ncbi:hypothetical protein AX16_007313 [Volvariella volvacea WC 439]|nr:hypothetical protein AX16_007313 [Volvariella volvacea WC 439]
MASRLSLPNLPLDVLRLIFECCAESDRQMAVVLSRTSRLVYYWIRLVLYRSVTLENQSQAKAFIRTIQSSPEAPSILSQIRSLHLDESIGSPDATTIIAACKNINSLTCLIEPHNALSSTLTGLQPFGYTFTTISPHLKHLSMTLDGFLCASEFGYMLPMFQTITHLHLRQGSDYFQSWTWGDFGSLTSMTHLAFDININTPLRAVEEVLALVPETLRVCLVMLSGGDSQKALEEGLENGQELRKAIIGETDPRIVVGTRLGDSVSCSLSRFIVRGAVDTKVGSTWDAGYWKEAEDVVMSRTLQSVA